MGINDLPKPGIKFRTTTGPGNFQRKLSGATRYGALKNLRDNQKAIVDTVKKYQGIIRTKGGLSRLQKRDAWLKIKKSDPKPTYADKYEIKQVLNYLGRGAGANKSSAGGKSFKVGGHQVNLTKEQVKRNLGSVMQRDELIKQESETLFASGKTIKGKSFAAKVNDSAVSGARTRRITGIGVNTNNPLTSSLEANVTARIAANTNSPFAGSLRANETTSLAASTNSPLAGRIRANGSRRIIVDKNSLLARRANVKEDRSNADKLLSRRIGGIRGSMKVIGIERKSTGFAVGEDRLPDNSKPKGRSAGIRPVGL